MNSIVNEAGGFDKVVFESVTDTLAGGGTLALGAYAGVDGLIPAGLPVGPKNATTGLHPIITSVPGAAGAPATLSGPVLGYVKNSNKIVIGGNNPVAIVLNGVMRSQAMPAGYAGVVGPLQTQTQKVTILLA